VNVLVTGASSGIGAATARAFAARGDTVGICARREDRLAEVLADLPGGKHWAVDLSDLDGIDDFAARADDELGGIDVLVNNAGIPKRRRTTTMTAVDVESVMAMNYFSPVRLTLAVLPRMLERGRGDVVNVSSMGVHLVAFGVGAYSASKAALELFTEALYVELPGTGVRAHLVVPGTTATEFSTPREGNDPPLPPGPTAATPEEVASAIVAAVDSDDYVSYATASDAQVSAKKAADPNGFLAQMRDALAGLRGESAQVDQEVE
jgi:short-subunit dehydrogenase